MKGQFDTDSKWREELNKDYEQGKDKIPLPDNIGSNKGFETIINNTNSLQQNQQSFNEYKADKKNGLYVEFGEFLKLIDEKVKVIDELPYKEDNTPDGNRKVIDAEVTKIRTELIYLRKEYKNEEDQKRFDEYKEDYKNKILKLRGSNKKSLELKENAKKDIEKQKYDKQKNLKENEENLKRIFDKLKDDLVKVGIWDDIKDWLNISFQWVDKHWQWCAGALCLIVIPVVLMSIFDGGNSVEISDGQAVPSLQGTWRVRLMEGQNVNEGATITQAGENNTQYNISIIRNDIPDDSPNMDYKFETALSVDWQKGIVTSPDLGEGTIEKESRSKNLKIVFDKWIFVSLKGY